MSVETKERNWGKAEFGGKTKWQAVKETIEAMGKDVMFHEVQERMQQVYGLPKLAIEKSMFYTIRKAIREGRLPPTKDEHSGRLSEASNGETPDLPIHRLSEHTNGSANDTVKSVPKKRGRPRKKPASQVSNDISLPATEPAASSSDVLHTLRPLIDFLKGSGKTLQQVADDLQSLQQVERDLQTLRK